VDWRLLPRDLCAPTAQIDPVAELPVPCTFCRYPALAGPWKVAGVAAAERQMQQLRDAGARVLILYDDHAEHPAAPVQTDAGDDGAEPLSAFSWFSNFRCFRRRRPET